VKILHSSSYFNTGGGMTVISVKVSVLKRPFP